MKQDVRFRTAMLTGVCLVLLLIYISLTIGIYEMTFKELVETILRINPSDHLDLVIFKFRLPRILLAALIGLGLGTAGAVLQAVSKNGLADPGILGINSGAGAAIVVFMFFVHGQVTGAGWLVIMAMPLFGLFGGLAAALTIYLISWENGRLDPQRFLLTGIAVGTGIGAFTLFISLKMKAQDFEMATVWLSGSIYSANWMYIVSMLPWFFLCLPIILKRTYLLDMFQLGEDSLTSLGVSVEREKAILLLSSIGLVSACVSVAGSISFVGLMAPHIARLLIGHRHKQLVPFCGVIGMILVIGADFIGKSVVAPSEIPVGIVIAIIGVPYFVFLLFKMKI
ncbi:iron complex transport system permease protein [Evansella caseinilytica]|uniref:Iron complex transport system permease protein n=1 Tax=Evansella caseinilytica TaxID=1503961 RepID=A0A1H3SV71_9BACI|nr:iron complex transport system permease protein [Evansella caseinilytica]